MRWAPVPSVVLVTLLSLPLPALAQEPGADTGQSSSDTGQTSSQGVKGFFVALGQDLKHLPSVETALTLGIGGGLALAVSPADKRLTRDAVRDEGLEETLDPGQVLGGGWVQVGGAFGTLVIGHLTSSPRVQAVGSDLFRAQIINAGITQGLKHIVNRERPDGSNYSFPSGHASASFASAAVLERHFGWKVGLIGYSAAAYVAVSRLSENEHYASDVIFGAALGMVSGHSVTVELRGNRFAVAPAAVPGGAAVNFTMVPRGFGAH